MSSTVMISVSDVESVVYQIEPSDVYLACFLARLRTLLRAWKEDRTLKVEIPDFLDGDMTIESRVDSSFMIKPHTWPRGSFLLVRCQKTDGDLEVRDVLCRVMDQGPFPLVEFNMSLSRGHQMWGGKIFYQVSGIVGLNHKRFYVRF